MLQQLQVVVERREKTEV